MPAKEDVAHELLTAGVVGRANMTDFIQSSIVNKTVPFHTPIKRNKLKTTAEVKKTLKGVHRTKLPK